MGKAWKELEKTVAKTLGGKRVSRTYYGESNTDVIVPDFPQLKIDCKRYKRFRAFSLFEEVRKKYCKKPDDQAVLVLRQHGKKTKLAVIDLDYFAKLIDHVRSS